MYILKKKNKKDKIKNENNDLKDIVFQLKYISYVIDYLLEQFKIYNSNEYKQNKLLNKLKSEIEKDHKYKNANEQRLQIQKKSIKLRKKLEERNNKIYFLPYKKVDLYENKSNEKSDRHFENKKKKLYFEDLINN